MEVPTYEVETETAKIGGKEVKGGMYKLEYTHDGWFGRSRWFVTYAPAPHTPVIRFEKQGQQIDSAEFEPKDYKKLKGFSMFCAGGHTGVIKDIRRKMH